ncbi:alanine racemase [Pelistega europaea]|uniref:Alanine racemase n=1 Tax=Pelistega europaea TaxID=106147 RepID=A0A7Y4LA01_9BURK|nr:alanine racemase [Pelistega europaea]NOL49668.1 alanine racemase [Pelistega europaea]
MPRPIQAVISTQAMAHNLAQVQERIRTLQSQIAASVASQEKTLSCLPSVKAFAVIKANAYGHGTLNALKGFAQADGLGMIDIADAVLCRDNGWTKPILLLEGFFHAEDIEVLQHYHITTAIHSRYQLELLQQAKSVGKPIDVMMKFNTGMNRLGFKSYQALDILTDLKHLQVQGIVGRIGCMSHFANADLDQDYVVQAAEDILGVKHLFTDGPLSICNSAASVRYPQLTLQHHENWVRPGICLYGSVPFDTTPIALTAEGNITATASVIDLPDVQFQPTMTLIADIIAVQDIKAGDSVGYGSTFTADKPMRVAVIACGYADGYPRSAPFGTPVTVDGVPAHVVGRVSMDMMNIDISHIPSAGIGSKVVLWGKGGPSIDEVADKAGRIGYEMMCNLARRVPLKVV